RINDFQQIPFFDSMICLPQPVQTVFSDQFLGSGKRLALIKGCSVIILKQGQAYTLPVGRDEEFKRPNPCDSQVCLFLFNCGVYRLNYEPGDAARKISEFMLSIVGGKDLSDEDGFEWGATPDL